MCIAIHPRKIHQTRFAGFSADKLWFSSSLGEKRAEGVWGGAVNGRYGKLSIHTDLMTSARNDYVR